MFTAKVGLQFKGQKDTAVSGPRMACSGSFGEGQRWGRGRGGVREGRIRCC